MIRLPDVELDDEADRQLRVWQAEVDAHPSYPDRVRAAKDLFGRRNTKSNTTFNAVKASLRLMCSGARRCVYCEDSMADEVEHIRPKDLYPEAVFDWDNYVYACGPCNGPKNNKFAVMNGTEVIDVTRKQGAAVVPPRDGEPALLNPRTEDPMSYLILDLRETCRFVVRPGLDAAGRNRAKYTCDLLGLNDRDDLTAARREAYDGYRARLREYAEEKAVGATAGRLAQLKEAILRVQHPTVWREMRRQKDHIEELRTLFQRVPEAIEW